jgi:hypothetical protein
VLRACFSDLVLRLAEGLDPVPIGDRLDVTTRKSAEA